MGEGGRVVMPIIGEMRGEIKRFWPGNDKENKMEMFGKERESVG